MLTEPPLRRMTLDQPGVGVSSAHNKSIARVTRSDDNESEDSDSCPGTAGPGRIRMCGSSG
jgi:hypothetical protein